MNSPDLARTLRLLLNAEAPTSERPSESERELSAKVEALSDRADRTDGRMHLFESMLAQAIEDQSVVYVHTGVDSAEKCVSTLHYLATKASELVEELAAEEIDRIQAANLISAIRGTIRSERGAFRGAERDALSALFDALTFTIPKSVDACAAEAVADGFRAMQRAATFSDDDVVKLIRNLERAGLSTFPEDDASETEIEGV